ncbi:MAG TPA: sugar ABC transporter substrate-binding protein [Anaeromyxobacter sp.]|nr:sugar ABC transporter substrate-binding protein [Anaeromyxobacter sp.]
MAGTVLFSLLGDDQEFQKMQAEEGQSAAARAGLAAEVVYCHNSPSAQLQQLQSALKAPPATRPVAIAFQPAAVTGLEALARTAVQGGVGWISFDAAPYLQGLQREFPGKLVALVSTDNREMGRLMARAIHALLPRGGKIVHLEGPSLGGPVIHRREGLLEGLQGSGVTLVKTLTGDWTESSGERAATFWLKLGSRKERPDLVAAQNDLMAAGAHKAIHTLRPDWGEIPFVGCDGLPHGGQRLVKEKVLRATMVQQSMTGAAVELVVRAMRGEKIPPATYLPPHMFPTLEEIERRGLG